MNGLSCVPDFVLVDARKIPQCPAPQRGIIRGDALSASIAAASIIAKTTRDAHMLEMDTLTRVTALPRTKVIQHLNIVERLKSSGPSRFTGVVSEGCEKCWAWIRYKSELFADQSNEIESATEAAAAHAQ